MSTRSYRFDSKDEFVKFISTEVLTAAEAARYLQVTRATLSSLVRRGKILPVKETEGTRLFLLEDLEKRRLDMPDLRTKYRPYEH